jgi:hypothetical protein
VLPGGFVERLRGHVEGVFRPDDGSAFDLDFGEACRVALRFEDPSSLVVVYG